MSGICLHFDTGGKGCVHKVENNECKSEIEIGDELRSMCILYTANNCSFFKCDDQKWNMPAPNGNVVTLNFPSVKSSLETWKKWKVRPLVVASSLISNPIFETQISLLPVWSIHPFPSNQWCNSHILDPKYGQQVAVSVDCSCSNEIPGATPQFQPCHLKLCLNHFL